MEAKTRPRALTPSSERETIEGAVGGARPEGPSALTESGRSTTSARAYPPYWRPQQLLRSSASGTQSWSIWRRYETSVEVRRPVRVTEKRREAGQHQHGPGDGGERMGEKKKL